MSDCSDHAQQTCCLPLPSLPLRRRRQAYQALHGPATAELPVTAVTEQRHSKSSSKRAKRRGTTQLPAAGIPARNEQAGAALRLLPPLATGRAVNAYEGACNGGTASHCPAPKRQQKPARMPHGSAVASAPGGHRIEAPKPGPYTQPALSQEGSQHDAVAIGIQSHDSSNYGEVRLHVSCLMWNQHGCL